MNYTFGPEEIARFQAFLQQSGSTIGIPQPQPQAGPSTGSVVSSTPQSFTLPSSSQLQMTPAASHNQPNQTAPITQLYQPSHHRSQQLGHPQPTRSQPAGFHPFLGLNLPTTNANQARMASASATIPRSASLSRRGRRGPAQHPPALQAASHKASSEMCRGFDISGSPIIRVLVKVLPPPPTGSNLHHQLYPFLHDSVTAFLTEYCLLHHYDISPATTVHSLLQQTAEAMESSHFHYVFQNPQATAFLAAHETASLQVLGLVGRGIVRPSGEVRLRTMPISSQFTVQQLASDRSVYASPQCIDNDRLIIHCTIRLPPVQFTKDGRLHHCLSTRFFTMFGADGMSSRAINIDGGITSGGEEENDTDSDSDITEVATTITLAPRYTLRSSSQATPAQSQSIRPSESLQSLGSHFLPATIWATQPRSATHNPAPIYRVETLAKDIYSAATSGLGLSSDELELNLKGDSMPSLVNAFVEALGRAAAIGDYTNILLPSRTFSIHKPSGMVETMGAGIEREVLFTSFSKYTMSYSTWFTPRADSKATLQTSRGFIAAGLISPSRIHEVKVLGALSALMLISGISPDPFNPLLFYLIVHNFDLRYLYREVVGEWHPHLRQELDDWLALGPTGDPSPFRSLFISWINMDIGVLAGRDEASHRGYASEILWSAIVGQEPPSHPELKAFAEGFSLPCRNGFKFTMVPKQFQGGASTFFTVLWTSAITGYDSIAGHLSFSRQPPGFQTDLSQALHCDEINLKTLITDFLKGSGTPCPLKFAQAKGGFSTLIDFEKIDTPGFRPRVFTWAVTGCPTTDRSNLDSIMIGAVADSDPQYHADAGVRQVMVTAGTISFRTCSSTARMPASYILRLAQKDYLPSSPSEPQSFKEAFEYWFLCELLAAVGGHSML